MNDKVKLDVLGLTSGQTQSGSYTLIMGEKGSNVKLPIVIGSYEAQTIAFEIEGLKPSRPMTHDLFKSFAEAFKITLQEVLISDLQEGIFFAQLIFDMDGSQIIIDARTSDAISLALRFKCDIYIRKNILDAAGIILDDEIEDAPERPGDEPPQAKAVTIKDNFNHLSLSELEELLNEALSEEDYDKAARLRDEITKRNHES
ncbi:MAG: bifunctional nuclease family protein [Flavobacteriales bacterium]|nr:bifunctional nuclease family protein [Flavobacteriales bacterium]